MEVTMENKTTIVEWYDVNDKMPPQGTKVLYRDGVSVGEGYTNIKDIWFKHEGYELSFMEVHPTHWAYLPRWEE